MFSAQIFPVKIEIQKSTAEFARRYAMPDVGAGACVLPPPPARPAPAGTRRHRLAPAGTGSPAGRVGSTGHRHRLATGCGHGHGHRRTRTDTDGHGKLTRVDAAKRRHGCGRL